MGRSETEPSDSNASSPILSRLATLKPKDGSQDSCDSPHLQRRQQGWRGEGEQKPGTTWVAKLPAGLTWPVIWAERFSFMEEMSLILLSLRLGLCGWRQCVTAGELGSTSVLLT